MTTTAQRMRGLGALIALAVLIGGVPWALWTYAGGAPWEAFGEPASWLTSELDDSAIVAIITALLWFAWAYFVLCVAIEVVRALQKRPAARRGVGAQPLARRLVASVLLLIGTATITAPAATAVSGGGADAAGAGIHASARVSLERVQESTNLPPGSVTTVAGDGATAREAAARDVATAPNAKLGLTYYVQPPQGRSHDCLWDIAERTLGDGMRWTEIYELNKGRLQADGNRLVDPDLIYPGWVMVLPDDAKGPNVMRPGSPAEQSTDTTTGKHGDTQRADGTVQDTDASTTTASEAVSQTASAGGAEDHSTLYAQLGLGGGLIAAGLLWGLRRKRGWNGGDPPGRGRPFEDEHLLQLRADRPAALFADRAMRSIGQTQGARPSVARLGANQMSVRFDRPPGAPDSGWSAGADAYEWTVGEDNLTDVHHDAASAAPQLVCIGVDGDEQVLVNLAAAGGVVSVEGDRRVATEMARSVVVDLATHAWADVIEVVAVGFHEDLLPLGGGRLRQFETLDEAIAHVRGSVLHRLSERVIVSAVEPSRTQAATLTGFATGRDRPTGVLCCGEAERAGLRLSLNADGVVVPSGWGMALRAQRLPAASIPPLVALYGQEVVAVEAGTPGAVPGYDPRVADPAATVVADVRLLGPVSVEAAGGVDDERRALAAEIVVCLALHPEGVHQRVLAGMIWPRGASDDVVSAAMEHAASWLRSGDGRDAVLLEDGRWRLDLSRVRVDGHIVAMAASGGASGGLEAIRYVQSAPLADLPAGRYAWLRPDAARRMCESIVDVAESASASAADQGRHDSASEALRLGLRGVPDAEVLWRRLLRLTAAADGDVTGVADEMFATLGRCGSPRGPEGSTLALVDDLLPDRPRTELTA